METVGQTFAILGAVCVIGAVVGGGLKAAGIEIPLVAGRGRAVALALVGVVLVVGGLVLVGAADDDAPSATDEAGDSGAGDSEDGTAEEANADEPPAADDSSPSTLEYPISCDADLWADRGGETWVDSDDDCLHDLYETESSGQAPLDSDTDNDGIIDSEDAGRAGTRAALTPEEQYADPAVAAALGR